jgi:hypothetical protein
MTMKKVSPIQDSPVLRREAECEETRSSDKEGGHLQPAKLSDRQFR